TYLGVDPMFAYLREEKRTLDPHQDKSHRRGGNRRHARVLPGRLTGLRSTFSRSHAQSVGGPALASPRSPPATFLQASGLRPDDMRWSIGPPFRNGNQATAQGKRYSMPPWPPG